MRSLIDEPGTSLYGVEGMSFTGDINCLPSLTFYYFCTVAQCLVMMYSFFRWNKFNKDGVLKNISTKMTKLLTDTWHDEKFMFDLVMMLCYQLYESRTRTSRPSYSTLLS